MFKRELGEAALDFVLVCVAYLGAFILHYGLPNPAAPGPDPFATLPALLSASLPFVLAVKLLLLLAFHAYRGMWRYVGVSDILTLTRVSVLSSLILLIGLPLVVRDVIIPRSVLLIDFLLFTFLLIGSRVSFAALNDTFVRLQSRWLPRVLIVGAGDLGELVVRSLIRARPATYRPVGFLDPDVNNRNRTMHGVRVLGTPDDVARVTASRMSTWSSWRYRQRTWRSRSTCAKSARSWACPRMARRRSSKCTSRAPRCSTRWRHPGCAIPTSRRTADGRSGQGDTVVGSDHGRRARRPRPARD